MESNRTIIIIGVFGQDGRYLQKNLEEQKFDVIGITRQNIYQNGKLLGEFSVSSYEQVRELVKRTQPREIYYLAAHHNSAESKKLGENHIEYKAAHEIHVQGLMNFLEAVMKESPKTRIFNASSSLIFDGSFGPAQDEETSYKPVGFYGQTKLQSMLLCKYYREKFDIFASSGILYNHESALRQSNFLSKKLIISAHRISQNLQENIELGNLNSKVDWGYAPDFVEAFQKILSLKNPDDFIVATGELNTVKEFAKIVFEVFGLDSQRYIIEKLDLITGHSLPRMGDYSKLRYATGWTPTMTFQDMVKRLVLDYLASINNRY